MRALVLLCLVSLVGCAGYPGYAGFFPFFDRTRVDRLVPRPPDHFVYSAQTNTVMTENEDGAAEAIRREWLAQRLSEAHLCPHGFRVESRRFAQPAAVFANGGDIVYEGVCL